MLVSVLTSVMATGGTLPSASVQAIGTAEPSGKLPELLGAAVVPAEASGAWKPVKP